MFEYSDVAPQDDLRMVLRWGPGYMPVDLCIGLQPSQIDRLQDLSCALPDLEDLVLTRQCFLQTKMGKS